LRNGAFVGVVLSGAVALATTEKPSRADDEGRATGAGAGQGSEPAEHTFVVGVGGAGEIELAGGSQHPGVNAMLEWEAVEGWLELELEASVLAADGGVEGPVDLLFKKPFRLAPWAEVMIGAGPEVVRVATPKARATYFGGEVALDFMFWPWPGGVGLWLEPGYDLVARDGVSQGIGATGGAMVGF
jgi:hypothetical protein